MGDDGREGISLIINECSTIIFVCRDEGGGEPTRFGWGFEGEERALQSTHTHNNNNNNHFQCGS